MSVVTISGFTGATVTHGWNGSMTLGGTSGDVNKFTTKVWDNDNKMLTLTVASGETLFAGTDVVFSFSVTNPTAAQNAVIPTIRLHWERPYLRGLMSSFPSA